MFTLWGVFQYTRKGHSCFIIITVSEKKQSKRDHQHQHLKLLIRSQDIVSVVNEQQLILLAKTSCSAPNQQC